MKVENQGFRDFSQQVRQSLAAVGNHVGSDSLQSMVRQCLSVEGKLTRPRTVYQLARHLGVPGEFAVPWACACELLHSASLVHDDLQDRDLIRRGAPTMWAMFGENMAINLGDYLMLVAPKAIMDSSMDAQLKVTIYREFIKMASQLVAGQCNEFILNRLEGKRPIYEEYIHCIGGKTAIFFAKIAKGVGILGGQDEDELRFLEGLFFKIGLVFQIQDDILDLYGDKQRDQVACDIREGKVSALIVHHLMLHPQNTGRIKSVLRQERCTVTDRQVEKLRMAFVDDGTLSATCRDLCQRVEDIISDKALERQPGLRPLVVSLLDQIIKPVNHLFTEEELCLRDSV